MMSENIQTQLAVHILEVWLLMLGFQPSVDWDENDTNCYRQYGSHCIWTVSAHITAPYDFDALWDAFQEYLYKHNALPDAVKFQPYDLTIYSCPCGCGEYLYASIYQ